jgi:ribosomal protein S18 acetylase RimI-like enzyme
MTAPVAPRADEPSPSRELLVIRRATEDDAERLAEMARRTFMETFGPDNTAENMAIHVAQSFGTDIQRRQIRDARTVTLLAEIDSAMVGFAQVRRGTWPPCVTGDSPIELWRFYVDRPFHGYGIAQALMAAVERVARELEAHTLWLGVWERNPRAIAFYGKCGFVDVGSHAFMFGTEEQTDRVMARALEV